MRECYKDDNDDCDANDDVMLQLWSSLSAENMFINRSQKAMYYIFSQQNITKIKLSSYNEKSLHNGVII